MKTNSKSIYKTSDFFLAVALYSQDTSLLRLESISNSNKKIFVFEKTTNLDGLTEKFWGRKLFAEVTMLLSSERQLKRILHASIDGSIPDREEKIW